MKIVFLVNILNYTKKKAGVYPPQPGSGSVDIVVVVVVA
jgi:hypothetical protein